MVEALKAAGARVYATDIKADGYPLDQQLDFISKSGPEHPFDAIITNPPYGDRGELIDRFIEAGLRRLVPRGLLALLLPTDCDSAKRRAPYFRDCAEFDAKIVLTKRIVWFERSDGKREAPKENHAWYVWRRARSPSAPSILYAPASNETAPVPADSIFLRFIEAQCRILADREKTPPDGLSGR
jgi:hypothetical protein